MYNSGKWLINNPSVPFVRIFDSGCHEDIGIANVDRCLYGEVISGAERSMEMMVWRFKYPNEINGTYPGNNQNNAFTVNNMTVTPEMLSVLRTQLDDYYKAYSAFTVPRVDKDHTEYNQWLTTATPEWNSTYTTAINGSINSIVGNTGLTREKLLKGWIKKEAETGVVHWGHSNNPYRVVGGGGDSLMSLGFTQIQSRYIYGLDNLTNGCTQIHGQNLLRPDTNVKGLPVWSANEGCGVSIRRAFNGGYGGSYASTGNEKVLQAHYGSTYGSLLLQADGTVSAFNDVAYELLTKAIAGYNQGGTNNSRWKAYSLPEMFKVINKACSLYTGALEVETKRRCLGLEYAIKVKNNIGELPLVDYVWRVPYPNPGPNDPSFICFEYGETLWQSHQYAWSYVRDKAIADEALSGTTSDSNPTVRIACPTL
jgi:hypothetical protein